MLEYNSKIKQYIEAICSPLLNHLDLKFGYSRTYTDGRQFIIRSDLDLIRKLLDQDLKCIDVFSGKVITPLKDELVFALWTTKNTSRNKKEWDQYSKIFWDSGYKIGVSAFKLHKDYVEGWTFSPVKYIKNFDLFCSRNLEVFKRFISYFNNRAYEFMNTDISRLQLFSCSNGHDGFKVSLPKQNLIDIEKEHINQFINEIGVIIRSRHGKIIKISPQEVNCLALLSKGHTVKQIAEALNISYKTSENHIYNIKIKTEYNLRSELVNLYLNQIQKPALFI